MSNLATMNTLYTQLFKTASAFALIVTVVCCTVTTLAAQTPENDNGIQSLRSDVGIIGLTANFDALNSFEYFRDDTLQTDGSTELEFVIRDVRMISKRLGVGFQVLTSFFTDGADDGASFGVASWGLGPVIRAYPFKTDRLQPYVQANSLFGNNLAAGELGDTRQQGGFRVRLGLRAGVAYRITNEVGFFVEAGPDWGSGRLFDADVRVLQINIGLDLYRFN